jgi:hypothetical protein
MRKGPKPVDIRDRFWPKVNKTKSCWLWTGSISSTGYGNICKRHGKVLLAHRVSYEFHHRVKIPKGKVIDHICRVRRCIRPSHLRLVTYRENTLTGMSPTVKISNSGQCIHGHKFSSKNTYIRKSGWKMCRACIRTRVRHYKHGIKLKEECYQGRCLHFFFTK